MNGVAVTRYQRNKNLGDINSPKLYYLKPAPGSQRTRTLDDLARDIELIGSMSKDDVAHVARAITRRMKTVLTDGDKVKIDGLGTFHITFNCEGSAEAKDCSVRNIRKVNIRFKVDNELRLVNDTTATTRNGENNVKFYIKGDAETSAGNNGNPGGNDDGGDGGGDWQDPNA